MPVGRGDVAAAGADCEAALSRGGPHATNNNMTVTAIKRVVIVRPTVARSCLVRQYDYFFVQVSMVF